MNTRKQLLVLLVVLAVGFGAAGCGVHAKQGAMAGMGLGALGGYSATGTGLGAAGGAAAGGFLGFVGGSIADMFGAQAQAEARAQGITSCTTQERWSKGVLVVDERVCNSLMDRGGFRGDPMPPTAPVPAVRYEPAQVVIKAYPSDVVTVAPVPPPPPGPPAETRSMY